MVIAKLGLNMLTQLREVPPPAEKQQQPMDTRLPTRDMQAMTAKARTT